MRNQERYEVAKFGGWSLANGERTKSAMDYVSANPDVHYVVPSGPGSVNDGDRKVTDHLIDITKAKNSGRSYQVYLDAVNAQFMGIADFLGYYDMARLLGSLEVGIANGQSDAWIISRGEAIEGKMLGELLDFRFVDPTEIIRFRKNGQLDERSYGLIHSRLKGRDRFVISGFYGLGADGQIMTFPRDGSDITGAVIARGINASLYQNLTSIDGVLSADPRIVREKTRLIEKLTFEEYRELGNAGIKVLHRDTIIPVANVGIPINVRHSLKPESRGTMVVSKRPTVEGEDVIGIGGRGGIASFNIHKFGMSEDKGIADRILNIIQRSGISIDYPLAETDRLLVTFNQEQLTGQEDEILAKIRRIIKPLSAELRKNVGFISIVGQGIRENRERVSRMLFPALDDASIKFSGFTSTPSGISIVVFVDSNMVDDAIRAAHRALIG